VGQEGQEHLIKKNKRRGNLNKKKNSKVGNIIAIYFIIHGLSYIANYFIAEYFGVWNGLFSFIFGNITLTDFFIFIPVFLGIMYLVVAYGLVINENWARVGLWLLCIQAMIFEFPIGAILSLVILIYTFTPSFSKTLPIKVRKGAYQATGVVIIVFSLMILLVLTGISSNLLGFTTYSLQGYGISEDTPESKISEIEQTVGLMDVLMELTAVPEYALQQQDEVLGEIAPYINRVKNRFSEASNAMVVNIEASYLLEIAENENIAKIYPVEPSFQFLPYEINEESYGYLSTSYLQLKADELWAKGITGKGITVAVMDTGINEDHPDLQRDGKSIVVGGLHLHGEYVHPHGTMVASCIAGQNPNIRGIAPDVNILNVEVFSWETIGGARYLTATNADILQGFEFIANWKELTGDFVILSCSWGVSAQSWQHDADVCTASANRLAVQYNIPVIAAAGNSGPSFSPYVSIPYQLMSPSGGKNVLSVGAVDVTNTIAGFSSRGPYYDGLNKPDVMAPGVDVPVLDIDGATTASGTSFACPYVSGVVALLAQGNTDLSSEQLYDAVRRGATDLGMAGYDYEYGYGLVNAETSLAFIDQAVTETNLTVMFITLIVIGVIIMLYPSLNKRLQKG